MDKIKFASLRDIHNFFSVYIERFITFYSNDEDYGDEEFFFGKLKAIKASRYEDTFEIEIYFANDTLDVSIDVNEIFPYSVFSDGDLIPEVKN